MSEIVWMNTPRFITAFSEWGMCFLLLICTKRKTDNRRFTLWTCASLALLELLIAPTGELSNLGWILLMVASVGAMYVYLAFNVEGGVYYRIYLTAYAFLGAEVSASLIWQIMTVPLYFGYITLWPRILLFIALYGLFYYIAYRMNIVHLREDYLKEMDGKESWIAVLTTLLIFMLSNYGFVFTDSPIISHDSWALFSFRTMVDLVGVIILYAYQGHLLDAKRAAEMEAVRATLRSQYDQYRNYHDNMEFIRIKYHDLKHQIAGLRAETDSVKREEWLDNMEKELELHHSIAPTGNVVLDSVIASKLAATQNRDIRLTVVADGALLTGIHVTDICTIIGNALDNAMEAVSLIEDPEKRMIHMSVSKNKQYVLIHISNYCESEPILGTDGIPKTTKSDKKNHGLGLKSIRYAVEKYAGVMTFRVKDRWASLQILIPVEKGSEQKQ